MSECKKCHAEIAWVRMPSGKMSPVDIGGKVEKRPDGSMVIVCVSHWSTCPFADQIKREREEKRNGKSQTGSRA